MTVLLGAAHAHAEPELGVTASAAGTSTPNKLAVVLGLASPWGEMGLSYQRQVRPWLAIETGIGSGLTGAQLVALPKFLFGSGAARFYVEAGPSATMADHASAGLWAAGEAGFESTFSRWTLGFGAGAAILAAGTVKQPLCFDTCEDMQPGTWFPEIRLTVGRNF